MGGAGVAEEASGKAENAEWAGTVQAGAVQAGAVRTGAEQGCTRPADAARADGDVSMGEVPALQSPPAAPKAGAAIGLLLAGMACFAVSDATAKYLSGRVSVVEMVWFRYVLLLLTVLPLIVRNRRVLHSKQPVLQVGRCMGTLAAALLFIACLAHMPLAEATALAFASPMFVTCMSALFLKEEVDRVRWVVVGMGFVGVLVVMQPGTRAFQPAGLLAVASALTWATAVMFTRKLSSTDSVSTTMTYSALLGLGSMSFIALPSLRLPSGPDAAIIALMGVAWCGAQWLVLAAYQRLDASALAPFAYTQLPFAALIGATVFGYWPTAHALLGMGIIVTCGLVAAWRARPRARREPVLAVKGEAKAEAMV